MRSGQALQLADERVYLSARARYSAPGYARELALSRLAGKLSRGLLGRRTGRFVNLADPDDGSQRQGTR